ncbi:MAG: Integrin alpha beta-propellor repeat protein [Myxococcales bacterium]|nr:Integrin alpha beta-propellor repeat protein [Myxococcales bacterium]
MPGGLAGSLIIAVTLCACGRVGFEPIAGVTGGDGSILTDGQTARRTAYIKASNPSGFDVFGGAVAISADGATFAVGAIAESSAATGINGNQFDNTAQQSGAVYVFGRVGDTWAQAAYVKASNTETSDAFGAAIAISADGNTLAVGAPTEDSAALGIDGDQTSNLETDSGAVYVFTRLGGTWSQQAYVKASNTGVRDLFGVAVALSSNGNTLAIGAQGESSAAAGINGNQADNSLVDSGAVYVLTRSGTAWTQQAYLKPSNTGATDNFGGSLAISATGDSLVIGSPNEDSGSVTNQLDESQPGAGAAYVFTRAGTVWTQQAYLKSTPPITGDGFGSLVAIDGDTVVVTSPGEDTVLNSGAAFVFARGGTTWTQTARLNASNADTGDQFGTSLALSGATVLVGAIQEDSAATGIGGDAIDNTAPDSGAVYMFSGGTTWTQTAYIKASNTGAGDLFGAAAAVSATGTFVIGAIREDSVVSGVDGNQSDNSLTDSGAAYVFY